MAAATGGSHTAAQANLASLYIASCQKNKVKPNSQLVAILERDSTPTALDLSGNYCGTEHGFDCLLEVIANCPTLVSLDLSTNYLLTENVKALCGILLKHPQISRLSLNNNRLYIDSGKELVRLARFNRRVVQIEVEARSSVANNNKIPEKIMQQLRREVEYNRAHASNAAA